MQVVTLEKACSEEKEGNGFQKSLILFVTGFFVIFVGTILLAVSLALQGFDGSASFGGFILIGPVPIVMGGGPEAVWLALLAVVLGILSIIMMVFAARGAKKKACA